MIQSVEQLRVMRIEDVGDLVDELAHRVYNLEQGQAATTRRAPIPQITPDKSEEDIRTGLTPPQVL